MEAYQFINALWETEGEGEFCLILWILQRRMLLTVNFLRVWFYGVYP